MSDIPITSNETPKTAPPSDAKPAFQDNARDNKGDNKPSSDAPKQK
ncbi:MAG: hypothetical protein NTAFB05_13630 [Nitrobacter sp.]|jgi:hypothetical protein